MVKLAWNCPQTGKQCAFMKIVQNALFRSCAARFDQIAFLSIKVLKIVTLASTSGENFKTVRFAGKLQQNALFRSCAARFGKSQFWASKLSKSSHWPQILSKKGKQCAIHEIYKKRSFQVVSSTFWPNRIFERQSCQNRHTGLKFSFKTGKQCGFHENCTKRSFQIMRNTFCQVAFLRVKLLKNRYTCPKFSSKRENSALFMKIVQNALFRSCAARIGQIAFVSVKFSKSSVTLAWNSPQKGKTVRFSWNCTKPSFQIMRSTFWPNRIFWGQTSERSLHLSQILFKTGKQCAFHENCTKRLFRTCPARFGQIAFVSVKVVKIGTLAPILSKKGKQCAFHENCTKPSFQVMQSTFWLNRILERQSCQSGQTGLKLSSKRENSALSIKIVQNALFRSCATRFGQIAFVSVKVVKWSHWLQIFSKKGKQCAFHKNCTKRSFQIMRSTFCPNRIFERQSSQNRHTGLKFSLKRENSAFSLTIVQNALFTSCGARFGQIAFLKVKVVKIVTLAWNSLQRGKTVRFS